MDWPPSIFKCSLLQGAYVATRLPTRIIKNEKYTSAVRSTKNGFLIIYVCQCIFVISFFFLRAHLFVLAPLSQTSGGVGTIRPSGSRCWRFGRDPCCVSRMESLLNFLALGTLKANPRVSATSPGIGFLHPLSPRTYVNFRFKPGFSARRGYTFISLFLHRAPLRSCRPAAVQPPSSSSLQLYARLAAVLVADYLIGAWHLSPHHTPSFWCAAASDASQLHVHRLRQFGR